MDRAPAPDDQEARTASHRKRRVFALAGSTLVAVLVLGGLVWLAQSALREEPQSREAGNDFAAYRGAWESAMRKAGVEATFPAGPVNIEEVEAEGEQSFSASFARLTRSRLSWSSTASAPASSPTGSRLERVSLSFPRPGHAVLEGNVLFTGDSFHARAEAPTTFDGGRIVLDGQAGKLTVEGFPVSGERRDDAMEAISDYMNSLLSAAPGLEVESAEIRTGSVRVEGTAPERILHGGPVSPTEPGTIMASDEES